MPVEFYPKFLTLSDHRHPMVVWMLMASLALHLVLIGLVAGLRSSPRVERAWASYQVSLVSLPAPRGAEPVPPVPLPPPAKPAAAPLPPSAPIAKVAPKPLVAPAASKRAERVKPAAPKVAPIPAGPTSKPDSDVREKSDKLMRDLLRDVELPPDAPKLGELAPSPSPTSPADDYKKPQPVEPSFAGPISIREPAASRKSENLMRDLLRGVELPPAAPKLGELASPTSPAETYRAEQVAPRPGKSKDIRALVSKLKVPEVPVAPTVPRSASAPVSVSQTESQSQPVLSEELQRELAKLQQPLKPTRPAAQSDHPATVDRPAPVTDMQVTGVASGFNPYLARVQSLISSKWIAPQVDVTGRSLQVVIKFRLDRSGSVSDVVIEKTSGNMYYDLAGKRAVLLANPLPPFPPGMRDAYLDTHFSFTVGGQLG